jgi:polyisoprenoid-binding protein YceI
MTLALLFLLAGGLLASPSAADPAPAADSVAYQFDNESSTMTVYGSSNVRDWTMDVVQINGTVLLGEADDQALPSIETIRVEVPVERMVSDKDRLQRHAHEALHKEEHPTISFTASDVQVAKAEADSFSVVADGKLTIKGNTRSVTMSAKGARRAGGALHVRGEHRLTLSAFNVERPSLMFGAIKVTDPVRVGFDVVLTPRRQQAASKTE